MSTHSHRDSLVTSAATLSGCPEASLSSGSQCKMVVTTLPRRRVVGPAPDLYWLLLTGNRTVLGQGYLAEYGTMEALGHHYKIPGLRFRSMLGEVSKAGLRTVAWIHRAWTRPEEMCHQDQRDRPACLPSHAPEPTGRPGPRPDVLSFSSLAGQLETSAHVACPVVGVFGSGWCAVWRPKMVS